MKKYTYTAAGYDGTSCGHAHATKEEALPCRTRTRLSIERVEVPTPPSWPARLLVLGLLLGGLGALLGYTFS